MFFAHASVLAANSSVLYSTIKDLSKAGLSSSKPRKLMLPSLKSDILGVVVDFIYGISPCTVEDELKLQKGLNTLGFHKSYLPPPPWVNMPQSGTFNVSEMLNMSNNIPSPSPKANARNANRSNNSTPTNSGSNRSSYVMDLTGDDDDSKAKKRSPEKNKKVVLNGEGKEKETEDDKMIVDGEKEDDVKEQTKEDTHETSESESTANSVEKDNVKEDIKGDAIIGEEATDESAAGPEEKKKFSLLKYHPYAPR